MAGKVIVIIGGTTGLGFSAARAFTRSGARVVVVGRSEKSARAAEEALGPSASALTGDASVPSTAPAAIQHALDRFSGFDGLYHVAGGSGRRRGDGPLHQITDEGWAFTLQQNLDSVFHSNRAAAQSFLDRARGGSVLNMGSVLGSYPSPRHFATHAYAAAKAAIIGLTRSAAAYYAPSSIRFNVIAPGLVETPMAGRALGDEKVMSFIGTKQPLEGGRIGQPSDLDGAVVYFLSDESRFVTGQLIHVDGGWSVSEGQYGAGSS
ncbi:MAG: SDR family oxidoreductase [Chloroflexi bacterium]|nr:SDR family oxidoreductase [Chloroflexota bacterium]